MRAIVAVISDLSTDMRVQKHSAVLSSMGFSVTLIGRHMEGSLPLSLPSAAVAMIRVPFRKGPMMYLWFNVALLFRLLLLRRADLYIANDLDTMIPCHMVSRLFRRPLVYDAPGNTASLKESSSALSGRTLSAGCCPRCVT